jgi:hypothetical protein
MCWVCQATREFTAEHEADLGPLLPPVVTSPGTKPNFTLPQIISQLH